MIFRRLLALLFAIAMTLAPLGMPAMAEAATAAPHHGAMTSQGHCDDHQGGGQPQPDRHHQSADKSCCAAMCIAAVVPAGAGEVSQFHAARVRPASDLDRRGYLSEIATPPPRLS